MVKLRVDSQYLDKWRELVERSGIPAQEIFRRLVIRLFSMSQVEQLQFLGSITEKVSTPSQEAAGIQPASPSRPTKSR